MSATAYMFKAFGFGINLLFARPDKGGREGGGDISRGQCPAAIVSSAGMGWWRWRRRRALTSTTEESTTPSTSIPSSTTIPTPQGYCGKL